MNLRELYCERGIDSIRSGCDLIAGFIDHCNDPSWFISVVFIDYLIVNI
jgi:hypothetical protein